MRNIARFIALAAALLLPALAGAQVPPQPMYLPQPLPPQSVIANPNGASGPAVAVPFSQLQTALGIQNASAPDGTVFSNISGFPASPANNSISSVLDKLLGTTQGGIAYRGSSSWTSLAPGTAGQFLGTSGPAANPSWVNGLRLANPTNFYVATTGNDGNNCLSSGTACLTLQRVINLMYQSYDAQAGTPIINIGSGTFCQATASGSLPGGSAFIILGTASTTVQACSGSTWALNLTQGARALLGTITLSGNGQANASDLVVQLGSAAGLYDDNVVFAAAPFALMTITQQSVFDANASGSRKFTISGGADRAIFLSTQSAVVTGVGVTNVITGTPNFTSAFVVAIDGSFFNQGTSSSFSGTATGPRYQLAMLSYIDTEQITTPLPGSTPGLVAEGSRYYTNSGLACIGGNGGCANVNAPTGVGTGATLGLLPGSGDTAGAVSLRAGTSANSSGTLYVNLNSQLGGPLGGGPFCSVSLNDAGTGWPAGSTVRSYVSNVSTGAQLQIWWYSGGVSLTNGATYNVNYVCE